MAFRYTLQEFHNIIHGSNNYELPKETIDIIMLLAEQVGAPTYIKTPNFQHVKKDNKYMAKKRRVKAQEISDDDWEAIRSFQTTEINKKEGIDLSIDNIRSNLNKITDDSYFNLRGIIIEQIKEASKGEDKDKHMLEIGTAIFDIASSNSFYIKLYADLYSDLMEKFPIMKDIFDKNYALFMDLFKKIECANPDENYDEFCRVNLQNEKRRVISLFFINLMKKEIINLDSIVDITLKLQAMVKDLINKDDNNIVVEEIIENISIILVNGYTELDEHSKWGEIYDNIVNISESDAKDYCSLSNKAIFKCMDIIDAVN